MSKLPEAAWVEAAAIAADRAFDAVGIDMDRLELSIAGISQDEAAGTNSADPAFLDYLVRGGHLNAGFLAGVK